MRILIVEDDVGKLQRVVSVLHDRCGIALDMIHECRDATSAKRHLQETSYDLLVLDVAIPYRVDLPVSRDGGVNLLQEVCERPHYRRPHHVCIITGYAELGSLVLERFPLERWRVINYDPGSDSWSEQLRAQVEHIIAARAAEGAHVVDYGSELAVICAVDDVELESVLRLPWNWEVVAVQNDGTVYRKGWFDRAGAACVVHAAASPRMGLTWAGILATKMISAFRPRYIVMTGICAGIAGRTDIGEVIIAESTWDYGSGKYEVKASKRVFSQSPHQLPMEVSLAGKVRLLSREHAALASIKAKWPAARPPQELQIRLGPMASGASVVADPRKVSEIEDQNRKVLAIDMESYAVFAAAADSVDPRPTPVVIKGVCDLADENKDDKFQAYAAYASAEILKILAERYLQPA